MKTVVFGSTGYLGSHATEQLLLAGHEVLSLVRAGSDTGFLQLLASNTDYALQWLALDLGDVAAVQQHIEPGCTVVNCIADTRMHISDDERRNVEIALTSKLYRAAEGAQASRFIQLSTVMAYGFDRPRQAIDETYPPNPKYSYSRIAVEREQALLGLHSNSDMELILLRPSNTLGKRDASALPAILQGHEKGIFAVVAGGDWQYSCMDARDVGRAMAHLLTVPVDKAEIFLVSGYDMSWLTLKAGLDQLLGKETRLVNIPKTVGLMIGRLLEMIYPYGSSPALTRFSVDVISSHTLFSDDKIRATGFKARYQLQDTLRDALNKPLAEEQ